MTLCGICQAHPECGHSEDKINQCLGKLGLVPGIPSCSVNNSCYCYVFRNSGDDGRRNGELGWLFLGSFFIISKLRLLPSTLEWKSGNGTTLASHMSSNPLSTVFDVNKTCRSAWFHHGIICMTFRVSVGCLATFWASWEHLVKCLLCTGPQWVTELAEVNMIKSTWGPLSIMPSFSIILSSFYIFPYVIPLQAAHLWLFWHLLCYYPAETIFTSILYAHLKNCPQTLALPDR